MIKKLLMLVVCVAVVLALVPGYVGAASPSARAGLTLEQQYTQAIDKLQRYLSISETGNIVLDAPKGIVKSIDSEVYQSLLAGIESTNSMIDSGYLVCNPDFTLTVTEKYLESISQYLEPNSQLVAEGNAVYLVEGIQALSSSGDIGIQALSSSGGISAVYRYWWGTWTYLSDAACDDLVFAMRMGGGVSAVLIAFLGPAAPIAAIFAGVMLIGAQVLDYVNRNNTGIKIRQHYILPFPTYIGAQ